MSPIGQAPSVQYHEVRGPAGRRFTFCFYTTPGQEERVDLGKARTKCPRCGAELTKAK